ncbi:gamma-butyrobetaine hydroxylase-like domain-containing protein [Cupriavidus pampae]|uniref:Gamma-butyrobetaine hydroxylase-like N-terminal domain-containing protein n=1 Tax=Cupriavidus pampae TaxID=659251 RepID=A0ABN7YCV3_9BURK|nr:DUF971 domain-containing protein [Cupriavidus pampae]CAG9170062.1 hypothetical protein LMG32289_01986 [Cupriavidus pampae]
MAGLEKDTPHPTALTVHTQSRVLEIGFDNGRTYRLPFELLRVCSPSAEVQGHGPGQETLQTGKRHVGVAAVEPVGNYAILIRFDDGHETGIYSWDLLHRLGDQQDTVWNDYLKRLEAAGLDRDAPMAAPGGHACGHHH